MTSCRHCEQGHISIGEQFITHDMALDAEEPSMEGQSAGIEWGVCSCCGGPDWANCPTCTAEIKEALEIVARAVRIFNISRNVTAKEIEKANKAMECICDVLEQTI